MRIIIERMPKSLKTDTPAWTIVVVEDDKDIAEMISATFKEEGFEVHVAPTVFQGRSAVEKRAPVLVVLDRKLPDADGLELCRWMRGNAPTKDIPIIFLSGGKKSTEDRVVGLTVGADDYISKPFSPTELMVRVRAILRRTQAGEAAPSVHERAGLRLDLDSRKVQYKGKELQLSPKEFDLLQVFFEKQEKALSRQLLLSRVWGYGDDMEVSTKVVDVTVGHLREKLGVAGKMIVAVTKFGYRFEPR